MNIATSSKTKLYQIEEVQDFQIAGFVSENMHTSMNLTVVKAKFKDELRKRLVDDIIDKGLITIHEEYDPEKRGILIAARIKIMVPKK